MNSRHWLATGVLVFAASLLSVFLTLTIAKWSNRRWEPLGEIELSEPAQDAPTEEILDWIDRAVELADEKEASAKRLREASVTLATCLKEKHLRESETKVDALLKKLSKPAGKPTARTEADSEEPAKTEATPKSSATEPEKPTETKAAPEIKAAEDKTKTEKEKSPAETKPAEEKPAEVKPAEPTPKSTPTPVETTA